MIKSVIFDWGGVLIDNPARGLISYCAESLGVSKESLLPVFRKYREDFQRGKIPESALWGKITEELEVHKPDAFSLWKNAFAHVYKPKKEMFDLAEKLHDSGYKTGFLSNTEKASVEYFLEQEYKMFDVAVFSCNEGYAKPEMEIYEIALNKLGVSPNSAVFIDDREDYIRGAKEVGINTILFRNPRQVKKELVDRCYISIDDIAA